MPKYEFAVTIKDESERHRKKAGDISSVRPYPRNCGSKTIKQYLIVIVETSKTFEEMQNFTIRQFADPNVDSKEKEAIAFEEGQKPIAKRRYKIPLDLLKNDFIADLDMVKVSDPEVRYQPFKSASQLVARFDGLEKRQYMEEKDVDTVSLSSAKYEEFCIDMDKTPVIWDKHTNDFIGVGTEINGKL